MYKRQFRYNDKAIEYISVPSTIGQAKLIPTLLEQIHPERQDAYLSLIHIFVACIDPRGTAARGEEFRKCTYMQLGKIESDDMIAAAKWLAGQSYIDAKKVGIWGWSFGGFMSSLCLMKGNDVFSTAIAVAPVTHWGFYDSIYTAVSYTHLFP